MGKEKRVLWRIVAREDGKPTYRWSYGSGSLHTRKIYAAMIEDADKQKALEQVEKMNREVPGYHFKLVRF